MPAYIGVNGKAKAIAKVYVGNSNGKAELIWGPKGPSHYSKEVAGLSVPRYSLNGVSIVDHALFVGGFTKQGVATNAVDIYDKTLTRIELDEYGKLNAAISGMASTYFRDCAIFGGGDGYSDAVYVGDYYGWFMRTDKLSVGRESLAAASCYDHAAFAGGNTSKGYSNIVDGYDYSLTRSSPAALSEAKSSLVGVGVGVEGPNGYMLFAGGYSNSKYVQTVEVYSSSLTKMNNASALSVAKASCAAASFNGYGIIAGGGGLSRSNTVDAYNIDLVKTTPTTLTSASTNMVATVLRSEYALFCGFSNSKYSIDAYDLDLTKVFVQFGASRTLLAATNVGDYALFAGGTFNSIPQSTVDAFHVFE